jgi:hypothetical protein
MTRFGKSRKSSSKRSLHGGVTRNPPRNVLTKSLKNLRDTKSDVQKHTTKELPYLGSAESAAIADLLNEPGDIDEDALKAKIKDSDECLNNLAFTNSVNYFVSALKDVLVGPDNRKLIDGMYLDERIPIMVSVGISKILSKILDDVKKSSKTALDNNGRTKHFIRAEDVFSYVDKHFSKVLNLKSQRITDENSDLTVYRMFNKITGKTIGANLQETTELGKIIKGLVTVHEKHVGKSFKVENFDVNTFVNNSLAAGLLKFLSGCEGRISFVTDLSLQIDAQSVVASIFGCIAVHIMSYTFVSAADNIIRTVIDAGIKDSDKIQAQLDNAVLHRALVYPSLVSAVDLYDLSENAYDHAIAKEITTVKAVREIFKEAIKAYDYEAGAIAAKTYRHEAPKIPSFLKSPEEILQAQMKMDKMLIKNVTAPTSKKANLDAIKKTEDVINQKSAALTERLSSLHGTWSFGRKRRSSKKRSSFGRKRRSSKRRVAEFGRKRRSSKKRSEFGRKRRSSKKRSEFGKRRRRRSVAKFGNTDIENIIQFGRRRRSMKKRASFGKKRRSMKKRASFGRKRRSSKRRASFGRKRRSSKRRASFGRKRRSSKRRN